jgi:hypothetical protein
VINNDSRGQDRNRRRGEGEKSGDVRGARVATVPHDARFSLSLFLLFDLGSEDSVTAAVAETWLAAD